MMRVFTVHAISSKFVHPKELADSTNLVLKMFCMDVLVNDVASDADGAWLNVSPATSNPVSSP